MEVCKSNMMGDESKNMENSVDERYRERSEIMKDHYCIFNFCITHLKIQK